MSSAVVDSFLEPGVVSLAALVVYGSIRAFAAITRHKRLEHGERGNEFDRLYKAQGRMLEDCQKRCSDVESQLEDLRRAHRTEIISFEQRHEAEVSEWRRKYRQLEEEMHRQKDRMRIIEEFFRGIGLGPHLEQAKRAAGGDG